MQEGHESQRPCPSVVERQRLRRGEPLTGQRRGQPRLPGIRRQRHVLMRCWLNRLSDLLFSRLRRSTKPQRRRPQHHNAEEASRSAKAAAPRAGRRGAGGEA